MRISVEEAIKLFERDEVVAIPTETVYGLAAPLDSPSAIEKVFQLKNRPSSNPLIIHVKDKEECRKYLSSIPPDFDLLTDTFWPGPLTLVLPVKIELITKIARADLSTAAFRQPAHPVTLALLQKKSPLVAPSANISGKPSATRPEHIELDFGKEFPLVDGGRCTHGVESTILAFVEGQWHIAREGAISCETLGASLGYLPLAYDKKNKSPICPGQLFRHYAPKAHLLLSKEPSGSIIVGFSDRIYPEMKQLFSLGRSDNPEEVAFRLYDVLRALDAAQVEEAIVDIHMPHNDLWITILERLTRAANR